VLIVTVPELPGDYDLLGYVLGSGPTLQEAMALIEADAVKLGAWGIVGLSFALAEETSGASWVLAYGTAVSQPG
jgi:uncharacterized protein YbjQ (UPF0145 family)